MAQFGDTSITPIQGGVSPQPGVSAPSMGGAVSGVLQGVNALANIFAQEAQAKQAKQASDSLSSFNNFLLNIGSAVENGSMKKRAGLARARNRLQEELSMASSVEEQRLINDTYKQALGTAGMAKVVVEGTEADQARNTLLNQGVKEGLIDPDVIGSDREEEVLTAYQNRLQSIQNLEMASKRQALINQRLSAEGSRISNQSAQLRLQQDIEQDYTAREFRRLVGSDFEVTTNKVKSIVAKVQSGEFSAEEGISQINEVKRRVYSRIASVNLSQQDRAVYTSLYGDTFSVAIDVASGKVEAEVAQNMWNSTQNAINLSATRNSSTANLMVLKQVLGETGTTALAQAEGFEKFTRAIPDILEGAGISSTNVPKGGLREILKAAKKLEEGGGENIIGKVTTSMVNTFNQAVGEDGAAKASANLIEDMASDEFKEVMTGDGSVKQSHLRQFQNSLDIFLTNFAQTAARDWTNKKFQIKLGSRGAAEQFDNVYLSEYFELTWEGGLAKFQLKEGVAMGVDPELVRNRLDYVGRQTLSTIENMVNNAIKAAAHLSRRDYNTVWGENKQTFSFLLKTNSEETQ